MKKYTEFSEKPTEDWTEYHYGVTNWRKYKVVPLDIGLSQMCWWVNSMHGLQCGQMCAYCQNLLTNQYFCHSRMTVLEELLNKAGTGMICS